MSATSSVASDDVRLRDLVNCFGGAIPSVMCTASADDIPNIIYFSRAHFVDDGRIALSNHFLSKTARNLAENPYASVRLVDPTTHDEYRLTLRFERTERRGPVFERLQMDVELLSELTGNRELLHLRAADVYRVLDIERVNGTIHSEPGPDLSARVDAVAELGRRIGRAQDLDALVDITIRGLDELLGFEHVSLLLADLDAGVLETVASRGYSEEHIGSEVRLGEGHLGLIAARCETERIGGLKNLRKYSYSVQASVEAGSIGPGQALPLPALHEVNSQLVVPVLALGELVALILAESELPMAFSGDDERLLSIVAGMFGPVLAATRTADTPSDGPPPGGPSTPRAVSTTTSTSTIRFFPVDGSVFVDDEYLIKGVAGRILRRLIDGHLESGRSDFTNRELRLDPSLQLPEVKDNLESRLVLLRRRLDERDIGLAIERTDRGRFRLTTDPTRRFEVQDET